MWGWGAEFSHFPTRRKAAPSCNKWAGPGVHAVAKCRTPAAGRACSPRPAGQLVGLTPLPAASPTGLSTPPSTEGPRGCPPPLSPPVDPFTFQQPLDDAVDVEFIYIRHRLSTADPPAAAPPPARARDSHLPSHATSRGGGSGCGSSRGGYPPNRAAACFLLLSLLEPREEQNGRRLLSQLWAAQGCARGSTAALPGLLYGP